jgi:xylan 1,4-beta-xylosidase
MKIDIHSSEKRQILNFWNHIHFHPTDAIEDAWGQRILDRVAQDGAAQYVRMYAMLEDIVKLDDKGNLVYDFSEGDVRIDYLLQKGFKLLLSYNFTPPCISENPAETSSVSKNATRYKGKMINIAKPKDYGLWEEICYRYTEHIVARYSWPTVSAWYLQCYNEPDIPAFFLKNVPSDQAVLRANEYTNLYRGFARGIKRVNPGLRIGGPTLAHRVEFMETFLRNIRAENLPIDFICYHTYGTNPTALNNGSKLIHVLNSVEHIRKITALAEQFGYGDRPLVIDEWGASSNGFYNIEECPRLWFRETEIFSAFFAQMITRYIELELKIDKMMICLSGQHEMKTDFSGFRNFFTLNFFPKPIYQAYVLAAKLGDRLLNYQAEANANLTILPTRTGDNRTVILLAYASPNFDQQLDPLPVTLKIDGVSGQKTITTWTIDHDQANALTHWERLGKPDAMSPQQIEEIRAAGNLSPKTEQVAAENGFVLELQLNNNGTC